MTFRDGPIDGIIWKPLTFYRDPRGWLCELFRHDELATAYQPVMAYISMTEPGVARGPHEHVDQADFFAFIGPSNFRMRLWDNRPESETYNRVMTLEVGADNPKSVLVPKGVVHAYLNVGDAPGIVINSPNRLYKGPGRKEPVDEIRHEDDRGTIYQLD